VAQGLFRNLTDFGGKCAHVHRVGNRVAKQTRDVFNLRRGDNIYVAGDI